MILRLAGVTSVGHRVGVLNAYDFHDTSLLSNESKMIPTYEEVELSDNSIAKIIAIEWNYMVFSRGVERFDFSTVTRFEISGLDKPTDMIMLNRVIVEAYNKTKEQYNERRLEYPMLPTMAEIDFKRIEEESIKLSQYLDSLEELQGT